ncbi:hypothetical protein PIB30_036766 [Stylosanthes scabra]|uniref:CCHC-type domain-containing protein n=1 Tax=Stylosanthes scabra TaxID=79078 RepID=A0ABU6UC80_9FABA|nr:hypothetical protein [Stylosanthes scabra]
MLRVICHRETWVATLLYEVATLRESNQPFRSFFHRGRRRNGLNNGGNGSQRPGNAPRFLQGQPRWQCQRCERSHGTRPRRTGGSNCHNCGKPGHLTRSFCARKSGPGQPTQRQWKSGQDDTPRFPRGHKDKCARGARNLMRMRHVSIKQVFFIAVGSPDTCRDAAVYGIDGPGQQEQQCLSCKGYHGTAPCRANGTSCFNCGQPWHFSRDCHVGVSDSRESSQIL